MLNIVIRIQNLSAVVVTAAHHIGKVTINDYVRLMHYGYYDQG